MSAPLTSGSALSSASACLPLRASSGLLAALGSPAAWLSDCQPILSDFWMLESAAVSGARLAMATRMRLDMAGSQCVKFPLYLECFRSDPTRASSRTQTLLHYAGRTSRRWASGWADRPLARPLIRDALEERRQRRLALGVRHVGVLRHRSRAWVSGEMQRAVSQLRVKHGKQHRVPCAMWRVYSKLAETVAGAFGAGKAGTLRSRHSGCRSKQAATPVPQHDALLCVM